MLVTHRSGSSHGSTCTDPRHAVTRYRDGDRFPSTPALGRWLCLAPWQSGRPKVPSLTFVHIHHVSKSIVVCIKLRNQGVHVLGSVLLALIWPLWYALSRSSENSVDFLRLIKDEAVGLEMGCSLSRCSYQMMSAASRRESSDFLAHPRADSNMANRSRG
ncbi:hypothetical protein C8F04DRAFT_153434 [Mycena alexandri]|uniref:Uncharacterized protein n=1 Tax=Mycena alexandri TaxID=1745969 RepID=A0AAD6SBS5_9AGAR|nr:hypothetical protein C8F04DRAFT_153434 [Mycena alexandri]